MAEHDSSSFSFDSAVNWLMNSPFAPNQVSEALKRGLAAHDIFEQGASMLRAKDIEIKALQEHARTSLGFEQIYTIEDFIQKLQNQLDSKDSRIESLSQALAKEQGEGSMREQQCKQQRTEIGELHQQNNDLCAQVEMFRNALSTTQQDNQAKDDRLRRGLEENEALRLEINRIPQIDMLTESLDNMRRAALKDQERLSEQAREIETLRGKLTAVQEDQLMMRIRELSAANDGLTSRLVEQNKQLGDLVTGGLSEQPEVQEGEDVNKGGEDVNKGGEHVKRSEEAKGDVLSKIGLKASMWATQSGSSIHTQPLTAAPYQHRHKGKDRRQETQPQRQRRSPTQHGNDLSGLSTTVTTPPPVPLGSKPSSYSGHHSQDRDIRMADVEEPERGDPQHNTAPYPVFTPRLISQRSSTPTSPKFGRKSSLPAKSRYYARTHLDHGSYSGPESDGEDE
ncbi:hypothetical protein Tdes44962_MAKER08448 [Teratosphaeria destructans]|uniref:Uncharacterized protein n=1 Tax=Teratosphaeria destructans TaxID=418781 RepID=A0A9W7W4Y5_9PEZI|nr:hypothetical protein Tdes44962_MAKER08448 [Teratosphaeria destructans]